MKQYFGDLFSTFVYNINIMMDKASADICAKKTNPQP